MLIKIKDIFIYFLRAELLIAHNGLLSILEGFMLISDTYQDTYVQEITGMTSVQHAIQKLRRLIAQGKLYEFF